VLLLLTTSLARVAHAGAARPHAMSDLSPECAPKRTSGGHSE
jgi:hypothetical protein